MTTTITTTIATRVFSSVTFVSALSFMPEHFYTAGLYWSWSDTGVAILDETARTIAFSKSIPTGNFKQTKMLVEEAQKQWNVQAFYVECSRDETPGLVHLCQHGKQPENEIESLLNIDRAVFIPSRTVGYGKSDRLSKLMWATKNSEISFVRFPDLVKQLDEAIYWPADGYGFEFGCGSLVQATAMVWDKATC